MRKYINKSYGYILRLFSRIAISFITPTKNRVLISCSAGNYFDGNSKRLFEVMFDLGKDVYFLTRNRNLYKDLSIIYHDRIIFSYSLRGLSTFLTCSNIVLSHGTYDTEPYYPFHKSKNTILLWHGFPFKKTGIKMHGSTREKNSKIINTYKNIHLMVSGSKTESIIYNESFGVDINNIKITGYPRYDLLLNKDINLLEKLKLDKAKRIILYAPTFRDDTNTIYFPFKDYSFDLLMELLIELDAILLLRFHKWDKGNVEDKVTFNERVIDLNNDLLQEVNEILPFVDILITDYSSLIMDFVIIDKPMIFIPYDVESYSRIRGLNFDWKNFYPGPIVNTFDDLLLNLKQLIINPYLDCMKRKKVISEYHQYEIGNSTKNVIELIDNM